MSLNSSKNTLRCGNLVALAPARRGRVAAEHAARMLARRRDWHRVIANRRGAPTIVVVPEDEFVSEQWRAGEHDPNIPDALENDAEERAEQAEQRAVVAERRSDEAHGRADAALAVADRTLAQLADAQAALTAERERTRCASAPTRCIAT